ncbi:MAG TPA: type II toxin-antitoxin system VapC family toxin [Vitreimonas sp.]|uniref:type II toxin-antitoxin system VapC family toxin n=1 Tax=Vitreimonas sp. TaxID=3069702 RepID=UPI002D4390F4|nr:type II toxin-antitoxin system VapC family toxin [Vitreimonas sp.]HYD88253.1 type II toxin-antitoxin system VapC family toxin [Vitreimonas sp.]
MSGVLVDTNVLLDLATDDPVWADWSVHQLENAALRGPLLINDVVYAELSVRFTTIEALNSFVADGDFTHTATPREALFLAAKAYQRYRAAGGARSGVLPDFFIGAHASVAGLPLLTRDDGRYRTYFPKLELITPKGSA